jgi:hypothetical protein
VTSFGTLGDVQPVLVRPRSARLRLGRDALAAVGVVAAFGLLITLLLVLVRDPATVPRLTVVNETDSVVEVEVASGSGGGWIGLGAVDPGASHSYTDVLDQGDRWRFRFSSGRAQAREREWSRSELEADGWRMTIPARVGRELEAEGAVTAPPR